MYLKWQCKGRKLIKKPTKKNKKIMPNNKIMERKIKKEFSVAVSVDSAGLVCCV